MYKWINDDVNLLNVSNNIFAKFAKFHICRHGCLILKWTYCGYNATFGVDDDCQTFSPLLSTSGDGGDGLLDGHCIIDDGNDIDNNCQTFSPNCAVKLPMSPSIRGKPVHVFAEDCLLISNYYYLQQGISSFLGQPNFLYIFSEMYTRLLSMNCEICIQCQSNFSFSRQFLLPRKVKFVWEWVLGNSASSDQGLT